MLVEVVGAGGEGGGEGEGVEGGGVEGGLSAFGDLEAAVAEEEAFGGDGEAVALEGVAGDEEVGDAGFVLEGDEAVAFGGAGTLAADDEAGDCHRSAVRELVEVGGAVTIRCWLLVVRGERVCIRWGGWRGFRSGLQTRSPYCHGVLAGGVAEGGVVGLETFHCGHGRQGRSYRRIVIGYQGGGRGIGAGLETGAPGGGVCDAESWL